MNVFKRNLAVTTDSYKISHPQQFPLGTTRTSYYIESRGGEFDNVLVSGLHMTAKILEQGVNLADVERANLLYRAHFGKNIFNYEGWKELAMMEYLPINLFGIQEGEVVPVKTPVAVMESTGDRFGWVPGHLETFALRGVWYPSTVGTISHYGVKAIKEFMDKTSDLTGADYDFVLKTRLHDFGARGVSSGESAAIGGLAHLMNSIGTDTVEALILAQDLFDLAHDVAIGISIPAREHSTTVSYGNNGLLTEAEEDAAFMNSIEEFGDGAYAVVMDSVDFQRAVLRVCKTMKVKILLKGGKFIFRPDSGNMYDNVIFLLKTLYKEFGGTVNSKGYKVLHPSVGVIQGDGIDGHKTIRSLLNWVETNKFATENVAMGMGGGLLQLCDRDTMKWAMKMSAIEINGKWSAVRKCPKGAEWKASKAGRLWVYKVGNDWDGWKFETVNNLQDELVFEVDADQEVVDMFVQYLDNGKCTQVLSATELECIRRRADGHK